VSKDGFKKIILKQVRYKTQSPHIRSL